MKNLYDNQGPLKKEISFLKHAYINNFLKHHCQQFESQNKNYFQEKASDPLLTDMDPNFVEEEAKTFELQIKVYYSQYEFIQLNFSTYLRPKQHEKSSMFSPLGPEDGRSKSVNGPVFVGDLNSSFINELAK